MSQAAADRERRLEEAIARYIQAVEAGAQPDRDEIVRAHPDVAEDLRAFFANHDGMERAAAPLRTGPIRTLPYRFGEYEILEEIARGGMGVVYRARQLRPERTVAVKMILAGRLASSSDIERFRQEAQAAASLEHPHIVPIYEVGEREGQHFFSMKLIQGPSLDARMSEFARDPRAAAQLMVTVARAVHHAHQRGFLHRDLKPGNILLDAEGRPHVTDFGLAMRVDGANRLTTTGAIMGTADYMAPEQAMGVGVRPTTSADVYSLGAILYEMLCGRTPFHAETPLATLLQAVHRDPEPLTRQNTAVDRDLGSVCLKALEKEPERRYLSAAGLARDLERWLGREPVEARPIGTSARVLRWCRRKPMAAGLLALAASLLVLLGLRWTERAARRDEILNTNRVMAFLEAERFRNKFSEWAATVERTARDSELRRFTKAKDWPALNMLLRQIYARHDEPGQQKHAAGFPFEAWHFQDEEGFMRGNTHDTDKLGENYRHRDYSRGALLHRGAVGAAAVHVSKIYYSEVARKHKFGLSTLVRESDNPDAPVLGTLEASITTDPTLGLPNIEGRFVLLAGPEDTARRDGTTAPARQLVLMHPAMKQAEHAMPLDSPDLSEPSCPHDLGPAATAARMSDRHHDPKLGGRWLAGYAAVGNTGFIVVVQTRYD